MDLKLKMATGVVTMDHDNIQYTDILQCPGTNVILWGTSIFFMKESIDINLNYWLI